MATRFNSQSHHDSSMDYSAYASAAATPMNMGDKKSYFPNQARLDSELLFRSYSYAKRFATHKTFSIIQNVFVTQGFTSPRLGTKRKAFNEHELSPRSKHRKVE